MKNNILLNGTSIAAALLLVVSPAALAQFEVVYDNRTNDLDTRYDPLGSEVGNEITLAGDARVITTFAFQYFAEDLDPGAQARLRFYANDGPEWMAMGALAPDTLLFDSGDFTIGNTERATLWFDGLSVLVPDSFTWTVQFANLGAGRAGLDLYSPPTIGDAFPDFWDRAVGESWELRAFPDIDPPAIFAAYIEAVPEPSTYALLLLAVFGGIGWRVLQSKSKNR